MIHLFFFSHSILLGKSLWKHCFFFLGSSIYSTSVCFDVYCFNLYLYYFCYLSFLHTGVSFFSILLLVVFSASFISFLSQDLQNFITGTSYTFTRTINGDKKSLIRDNRFCCFSLLSVRRWKVIYQRCLIVSVLIFCKLAKYSLFFKYIMFYLEKNK